ncbi:Uma2 family endonuclease [Planctopirus hydrillae]|uniref:Putative restriction endonuclease domain-containing protein n=1 Tax=Planctopirus hydrillae TaxID=1841610 RepID=A0A1C3E5K0_9PLAN|nr:Uma2 family endonuclease [Planctopirus hydrillae]ODA28429.1 hypothetical protein A6X21_11920 [Planctopirus hydrillae]
MTTLLGSKLLTADEYGRLDNDGRLTELVRGRVFEISCPFTSHGYFLSQFSVVLNEAVRRNNLGRVVGGGAGLITQRDPDTVRGPDLAYYSYQRIPAGSLPEGYWPASPELVIEIRSQSDRWKDILQKVAEYLNANVLTVAVIDPSSRHVHVYSADQEARILTSADLLTFPDLLPGFEVVVGSLFE